MSTKRLALFLIVFLATRAAAAQEAPASLPDVDPALGVAKTYDRNALGVIESLGPNRSYWPVLRDPRLLWRPFRGEFREALTHEQFFRAVGRPDLASRQSARRSAGRALFWGGIAVGVVGVGSLTEVARQHVVDTPVWVSWPVIAGGLIMLVAGEQLDTAVVTDLEAKSLAQEYDRQLREHLLGTVSR
jgi:hypothetical protein